ncbi:MAG: 5'-methylthioadenosine/adenosylhomocysteine nucleosidase [Vicinamibacteria bacterium]|jgi:adenosylhomocysteine nucleosidase|nr:5'-methylthioadenosine/adenosylhomocysteine nucleosidase [Vicinamibacteria bacterium]
MEIPKTGPRGSRRRATVGLVLALAAAGPARAGDRPPVLLLGALPAETQPVEATLADRQSLTVLGVPVVSGSLDGRPVVVAATGVGKVNAAMTTALLLERFTPAAVIFTGIAGALAPGLEPGDVVVGERLVQHDLVNHGEAGPVLRGVRSPVDGSENPIVLTSSPELLALAREAVRLLEATPGAADRRGPRVLFGTIATGDSFVGSRARQEQLRAQTAADAIEMEGAAVAQVCRELRVPFLVIRALSDRAGAGARDEMQRNLARAAQNAARLALAVARGVADPRPAAEH